jgi:hypothetical protein
MALPLFIETNEPKYFQFILIKIFQFLSLFKHFYLLIQFFIRLLHHAL